MWVDLVVIITVWIENMAVIHMLLLMLVCWTVGEVYCQTFPLVSFMSQTLVNNMWTSVKWGMISVVVTVFSVSLTIMDVVVLLRVTIVETGISLMELDCLSEEVVISTRVVVLRELIYVVGTIPPHQLVYITVIFQLLLSMMIITPQ